MAETVVLANLMVDSKGVVSGVSEADKALAKGEAATARFSKQTTATIGPVQEFVKKLFNLKEALSVVGTAFGIIGLFTLISSALRKLIPDILNNIKAWQRLKESFTDYYNALLKGETAIGRVSRKIAEAAKEAGISSTFAITQQMEKLTTFIREAESKLATASGAAAQAIRADIAQANQELEKLFATMEKLGISREQVLALGTNAQTNRLLQAVAASLSGIAPGLSAALGARAVSSAPGPGAIQLPSGVQPQTAAGPPQGRIDVFSIMGVPSAAEVARRTAEINVALASLSMSAETGRVPLQFYAEAVSNIMNEMEALGFSTGEINSRLREFGIEVVQAANQTPTFLQSLAELLEGMNTAQTAAQMMVQTFQALGNAIATALLDSGVTMRQAVVEVLKQLARMAIIYALMFTAAGIVASTGYGAAILGGSPAQFFKAAAAFAAVAVAAGVAAKVIERGGSGRDGREPTRTLGGVPAAQQPQQVVNVNVEGSLLGTDEHSLARSISDLITTAQADGA